MTAEVEENMQEKFQLFGNKERPQHKPRPPTQEEMTILGDLVTKAGNDATKAVSTTIDLAGETAGLAGVFLIVQKVAQSFMHGSALTLGAIRKIMKGQMPADSGKTDEDDLLFACLLAFTAEAGHKDSMDRAIVMFHKVRGYRYDLPSEWVGPKL